MEQPALESRIEALINGNVSGQVAVGRHNVQVSHLYDSVVMINPTGQQPQPVAREISDRLRPRPFPNFVDRKSELQQVQTAVTAPMPVQIYGPKGIGKTSLLRALSERVDDNLLYFRTHRHEVADILQELFDAFYDWPGQKPTPTQIRKALRDKQALVMLDDLDCYSDDLTWLLDAVPGCTFTCASTRRSLWGEGQAVRLGGVDHQGGLSLLEQELARPLSAEERAATKKIWESLEGHPFHLIRAAALVQEGQATLAELAQAAVGDGPLLAKTLSQRTRDEKAILVALAAVGDAPLDAAHVERLTQNPRASEILEELRSEGLVQALSPRFTLSGDLPGYIRDRADLDSWSAGFLRYFINWAEQHRGDPETLLPDLDAMLATLDWAVANERWAEVVRLGRAIDNALTLSKRWGAWERVLGHVRQAAEVRGDQAAEAWALHHLGVRALSLEAYDSARPYLEGAVHLRSRLGDEVGRDFSQYHLELLGSPPPPSEWPPQSGSSSFPALTLLGAAVIALGLIAYLLFGMGSGESDPTPTRLGIAGVTTDTPAVVPVSSSTGTPTGAPTDTPLPTDTSSPTPTPTPSNTLSPTPTPSATSSPTPTPTDTPSPTPTPTICPGPPGSWVIYTVQPGDTLFTLASETNTTLQDVRQANCMAPDEDRIEAGQDLWLPRLPQPPEPDLIVSNVAQTDSAYFRHDQRIAVPIAVTIRNQGDAPADRFKVSVDAITEFGRFLFPFNVPGQDSPWYPFTDGSLAAGDSVTFSGEVSFDDRYEGQTVRLIALADSCEGEEFVEAYCRVEEDDENNNESSGLAIDLPTEPEPPPPPDLIVGDIAQMDSPYWDQGQIAVPVAVTIRNQGGEPADVFKVSIDAITESGRFLFPFTVPRQDSPWYPFTDGSLASGDSVTFVGEVLFDSDYQGQTVRLIALADSCVSEEFAPSYCRVDESVENNNESFQLPVDLPFSPLE